MLADWWHSRSEKTQGRLALALLAALVLIGAWVGDPALIQP